MSRQTLEAKGHEKLDENGLGVATRARLLKIIYVVTLSKYVATQSKSKPREQVTKKNKKLR